MLRVDISDHELFGGVAQVITYESHLVFRNTSVLNIPVFGDLELDETSPLFFHKLGYDMFSLHNRFVNFTLKLCELGSCYTLDGCLDIRI